MKFLETLLQELKDLNLDKKGKCMVRGDVQGLAFCQGFDSCIEILAYHVYKYNLENKGE